MGETVTLWGTIRCLAESDMADIQANLRRLAEHQAASFGATAAVEYLQDVPPVTNTQTWLDQVLPSVRSVVGDANLVPMTPTLGYDDVSVFIKAFGGAYLGFGVQDTQLVDGALKPVEGGRGLVPNHNPSFYADDDSLTTSLRVHLRVAADHLTHGDC